MKLLLSIIGLVVPLIGITLVYIRPNLKDQSLELIMFLRETVYKGIKGVSSTSLFSGKSSSSSEGGCLRPNEKLFLPEELAKYSGDPDAKIYLAYLGVVYDVTQGARHYGPGGSYSFFSGKDATKAFVTGQFNEEGLVDDVAGLSIDSFSSVRQWQEFYESDYPRIGVLKGTYYDDKGCPTSAVDFVKSMYAKLEEEEAKAAEETEQFPYCNSEYHDETKYHRVWCSDMSGGAKRNWVGVPRQLYLPKDKTYRCACVRNTGPAAAPAIEYADDDEEMKDEQINDDNKGKSVSDEKEINGDVGDLKHPRVKEYPNCDPKATECILSSPLPKKSV